FRIHNFISQILGTIIAPSSPTSWDGLDSSQWIAFKDVTGLNVYGSGLINGQGMLWWDQSCRYHPNKVRQINPKSNVAYRKLQVLNFLSCNEGTLSNIHIVNSPQTHVLIIDSKGFNVDNVMIQSPQNTPNTDGDDCISIGDFTSNIDIANIKCGPGHGIRCAIPSPTLPPRVKKASKIFIKFHFLWFVNSIGSLGKDGEMVQVENIHISDSSFKQTTNGARIKTWQVGQGNVRHVIFENLVFDDVENPIIIDQYYCAVRGMCKEEKTGVKISDVVYKNLYGTSSSKIAINLNCSRYVPCSGISMKNINLVSTQPGNPVTSSCTNAVGTEVGVNPACLRN
ncbi:Glycoside hydrolase, family 28, partial [Cynara cardunculus var. scolymus]